MTFHWRPFRGRAAIGRPLFDDAVMLLEDRIMLDAVPAVTVTPPDHVFLTNPANNFQVTLAFDNHAGSQPGYGPYIEVIVPKNGADGVAHGAANADGATFVGATYLGQPVIVAANLTFNAAGHATNPLSGDVVNGTAGDGLVVLQLPFGSFTPPQTTAAIVATFAQSPLGNIGVPLTIAARGGFQFGLDPLNNPTVDPHIVATTFASATYTPTIAILTKTSDAPANLQEETATGPNNDHFYTLNLDVAAGQRLTNATLSDALPDSVVYLGATITSGTGTITHQPTIGSVVNPADNLLSVNFASITGTAATTDAVVKVHFYVNNVHFDGTPVINPASGAVVSTVNDAHLTSTFTPIDPIDPVVMFMLDATHPDTIQDKPIAVQKSAVIAVDTGPAGLNSGDTIEYRLTIQVSDYFTLGNLSLTDTLSDGQRLDTSFAPTIQLTERGVVTPTTAIAGVLVGPTAAGDVTTGHEFTGNFASLFNAVTGVTTSTINLSNVVPGGLLAGGRTLPTDGSAVGGTTVTIIFRAVVQNNFETDTLDAAHRAVHQGDTVGNGITIAGSIRDNLVPTTVLGATATRDDGAASLTIARGGVTKSIYAINGDTNLADFTVAGNIQLVAGDRITYRLAYDLPVTSYQALSLTDFLPLPVLAARSLTFNNAAPFVAGNFAYGPADTLHLNANAPAPVESFDAAGNSVKFVYPDYSLQNQGAPSKDSKIDLLFTVAVQDSTIADGLFLTNLATSSESNTPGNATSGNSIVRFALGQPRLTVQKAIVTATAGTITTPETVAGITFLAPGVVSATGLGYTATAPITDASLGATTTVAAPKLNSNVIGLDAGDSARVAIVVNNQGSGANGAFNAVVTDTLAAGTGFLGGSLATANLIVSRGDGTVFHVGTDYTVTSTATGFSIQFVDGPTGKIERNGATDNGDIVLVTYDIQLGNTVVISPATLTSSVTIPSFAAVPAGVNQVTVVPTDPATIGLLQPTVIKTLLSTTDASTTGGNLTIGENATYQVTYTLAEGTTALVRLADVLPVTAANGQYQFVSASIVSVGANLKQADGVTAVTAAYFGPVTIGAAAGTTTATFGGAGKTIVDVADNIASAGDQIVVNYVVRAANVAANTDGLTGVNTGQLLYANTQVTATAPIGISLPDLTVVKAFLPGGNATPDAGDPVNFTITVTNPGTVTGYALALNDPLPSGLANVTITGVTGAGLTAADFSTTGNTLTLLNHLSLAGGQSFTVSFAAMLSGGVNPGGVVTNTATLGFATGDGTQGPVRTVAKTSAAAVPINADSIAKTIFTTSVGNDANPNVVIGELVSFDLTASLAEGTSNSLAISDGLPAGLVFVSGQVVSVGSHISGATLAPAVTIPGGVPTFTFGTVTDLADNTPQTAADQIVVRIVARVADVPGNISHTVLTDVATVATAAAGLPILRTAALPVTVTVPDVLVAKTLTSSGTPDAGDTVTFTINVKHAADSTATAYGFALTDALPAGLAGLQVVAINNDPSGTGANGLALTPANFTTAGNSLALAQPLDLAVNQSFTVTISAIVADTTVVGSTIINDAKIGYSTDPGNDPNARNFTRDALATVMTAASQTLTKAIIATDDPLTGTAQFRPGVTDLAIGETATVQLVATFAQGTTPGVVIVDHLPVNTGPAGTAATFGFTGAPALTLGPGITFTGSATGVLSDTNGDGIADTVTYTLGAVTVPGTPGAGTGAVTVTYGTTPLDRTENAAGDALASPASLTSALGSLAANVDYDLVAPSLVVTKAVQVNAPGADAGDVVVYTIHLANLGTGPAADIVLADVLPPGLLVVAGGAVSVDGGPYLFQPIPTLAPGSVADVFYTVQIEDSAVAGSVQTNVANVTYDSHVGPGGHPASASANASFTTLSSQALTKTITATNDPLTGSAQYRPGVIDLAIGEDALVQLVATLQQGTTNNVVITDHLPTNVGPAGTSATFGFTSTVSILPPPGATFTGSLVPVFSDTDGNGIDDTVTFNLGNVTVPGSGFGVPAGPGTANFVINYATQALNRPETQAGDALASSASLVSALGTAKASVDYDIVAPTLVATKAVTTSGTPDAGDTVAYTVTLTNTGTGPAENIVLADPGPTAVRLGSATITVGATTTMAPLQFGSIAVPTLLPGQVATITYNGIVTDAAVVGQPEINTATATYGSNIFGGRPASVTATASFSTAASQTFTKVIIATDDPLTDSAQFRPSVIDLGIGETAFVTLTATFAQGTTPNVVIVDHLPVDTGPSATNGTLIYGAVSLVPQAGVTFTGSGTPVFSDTNGDGIVDTVTYTLGAVTVAGTPGAGTGAIAIRYATTVSDRPENVAGDMLASPASLTSALGALAANVDYDLVAPAVIVTKVISTPATSLDAGDQLSYVITLINTGTGPAADFSLTDQLPPGVLQAGPGQISVDGGPNQVFLNGAGFIPTLAAGSRATITIVANIADTAITGATLTNTATATYDSHAGIGGRPGSAAASASFTTLASQALTKTITQTSDPVTGTAQFRPGITDLGIGEQAGVRLVATLQQGTTSGVVLTDHLPVNVGPPGSSGTFAFVTTPFLSLPSGATVTGSTTPVLSDTNGDGIPDTVTYTLGNVTIPGTVGNGTGDIAIFYVTTPLDRPENQAGDVLESPATLVSSLGSVGANVSYDLVAPIVVVAKSVVTNGIPHAGDSVTYTVTLTNTGSGPAEGLNFIDPGAPNVMLGNAMVTAGGASFVAYLPGGLTLPTLLPGASDTITYTGILSDAAVTGSTQGNTATATFTSGGSGGHSGAASSTASFMTAAAQTFTKAVIATSVPSTGTAQFRPGVTDLVIGERATFELVATLSEGTTTGVVITDHLPTASIGDVSTAGTLAFIGTPVISIGGVVVAVRPDQIIRTDTNGDGIPDTITFNLGDVVIPGTNIPANDTVRIRYDVLAPDLAVNAAGDLLNSPAVLASSLGTLTAAVDVDLVQPALSIVTTANVLTAKPGDIVTYTVVVANPAGSAQAEDVVVSDLLASSELVLVNGSVATSQGVVTVGNQPGDTTVAVGVGAVPVGGAPVTITFQASVGTVSPGTVIDTVAGVTYDGIPGTVGGQSGRSATAVADAAIGVIGFAKSIIATSLPETGSARFRPDAPDLAIGENATISLTATLPAGTTSLLLTDLLGDTSGHLELIGAPVVTVSAGVTAGPLTTTRPDLNNDGFADLGFAIGTVTAPAGGGTATITYMAKVSDIPGNVAGGQLNLPATLTLGNSTLGDSRAVDLVAPIITLAKAAAPVGVPHAGGVVGYTVTATNSGSGPAYDVTLNDALPSGLQFVTGSARLTVAGLTTTVTSPKSLALPLLDAGQTAVLHFDTVVSDSAVAGGTLTNRATIVFDSVAGSGGRPGTAAASATVATDAAQSLMKTIIATSEQFTGTGQFRPNVPDLTIGEAAMFELRATFSAGTISNVVLTDTLQVPGGTLSLTGTPVIVLADGSTMPFTGSVTSVDLNGDGVPDQVRFNLGSVTIPGTAVSNSIAIRYQAVAADRPENHAGDLLTLPATLTSAIGTSIAAAAVDLVSPVLTVTKLLATLQPVDGQSAVFILTVGHAANSSAAATGLVLSDLLPAGSLLAGPAVIVAGPSGATVAGGIVTVPLLNLGDTLVVRVTTIADVTHPAIGDSVNRALITYGTTTDGGGHLGQSSASVAVPLTTVVSTIRFAHDDIGSPGEERRYISPLLPIEPVYSGAAEPGSFVELVVTDEFGSISGEGGALTDAGGNWLIRLPSTSVDTLLRDATLDDYYASTRLFSPPDASLFASRDLFGYAEPNGVVDVGSIPAFGTQIVHINVTDSASGFTAVYAPTWRDQVFVEEPGLSIERAFTGAAGRSIRHLYDELAAPEAAGLNRFNHAFLSAVDL